MLMVPVRNEFEQTGNIKYQYMHDAVFENSYDSGMHGKSSISIDFREKFMIRYV